MAESLERWLVAAAYLAAALLALRAAARSSERERTLWRSMAATLVVFAAAKALQLEDDFIDAVRGAVQAHGWYGWHREAQALFFGAVAAAAAGSIASLIWWLGSGSGSAKLASAIFVLLVAFVAVRATSIHLMDLWAPLPVAGMRAGWWVETIALVAFAAAARRRQALAAN